MRRVLSVVAIAAVSVGLLAPSANAATNSVVSYNGLPSDWDAASLNCATWDISSYAPEHVVDPTNTRGTLKISSPAGTVRDLAFGFGPDSTLAAVTAFSADVLVPVGGAVPSLSVEAQDGRPSPTPPAHVYTLSVKAPADGSWHSVDGTTGLTVETGTWNNTSGTYKWTPTPGTQTLQEFAASHPNVWFDSFDISLAPNSPSDCVASTFYVDNVSYTTGGIDQSVNFEVPTATTLAKTGAPASVLVGSPVNLGARLTAGGEAVSGQSVSLWARPTGKGWSKVATSTTDVSGAVSARVVVSNTTTYQWRYASSGTNPYAPANASAVTVTSRQRVTTTRKPASVVFRKTAVVSGRITPGKAGVIVRLVRVVKGRQIVVASARTTAGGYYTIKAPMTVRGSATYFVRAVAYTGQAAGQGPSFKITTK